jgi:hypothetical protein
MMYLRENSTCIACLGQSFDFPNHVSTARQPNLARTAFGQAIPVRKTASPRHPAFFRAAFAEAGYACA